MASLTCTITATGYTRAQLTASFTGGDPDYSRDRYLRLTLDGRTQDLVDDSPGSPDYGSSDWNREISPLSAGTTYAWSAVLVYVDGQGNRVETGYTASGSFTTPDEPPPAPTTGPYIWNGSQWKRATPYVWNGSAWVEATANIWNGSQWKS